MFATTLAFYVSCLPPYISLLAAIAKSQLLLFSVAKIEACNLWSVLLDGRLIMHLFLVSCSFVSLGNVFLFAVVAPNSVIGHLVVMALLAQRAESYEMIVLCVRKEQDSSQTGGYVAAEVRPHACALLQTKNGLKRMRTRAGILATPISFISNFS